MLVHFHFVIGVTLGKKEKKLRLKNISSFCLTAVKIASQAQTKKLYKSDINMQFWSFLWAEEEIKELRMTK